MPRKSTVDGGGEPTVVITSARVDTPAGRPAALIELIEVGGGVQTVTVDGQPEDRIHPTSQVHHVRLLSPDRMIPDDLREVPGYDDAVKLGVTYAQRLAENATRLADLAEDLRV
jgi:hypothetical protein